MHDKPWLLLEQLSKLIDFYKQQFGADWEQMFQDTVSVVLPDENY